MNATLTTPPAAVTPTVDPMVARADFFFDLELMELSLTIPQAPQPVFASAKY